MIVTEEPRGIVVFLMTEGVKVHEVSASPNENSVRKTLTVHDSCAGRTKRFREGRESFRDDPQLGPSHHGLFDEWSWPDHPCKQTMYKKEQQWGGGCEFWFCLYHHYGETILRETKCIAGASQSNRQSKVASHGIVLAIFSIPCWRVHVSTRRAKSWMLFQKGFNLRKLKWGIHRLVQHWDMCLVISVITFDNFFSFCGYCSI